MHTRKEYRVWLAMIREGTPVCDRWRKCYESFFHDMGDQPDNTRLYKVNKFEGYSPENCTWMDIEVNPDTSQMIAKSKVDKIRKYIRQGKSDKLLSTMFLETEEAIARIRRLP